MRRVSTGAPPPNTGGASLTGNSPPGRAKPQRILPGQCIKKRMAGVKRRRTRQADPPRTGSKNTEAADRGEYQWFAELPGPPALAEPQYRKARASGRRVRANGVSGRVRAVAESHLPAAMELRDGQSTGCPRKEPRAAWCWNAYAVPRPSVRTAAPPKEIWLQPVPDRA